MLMGQLRELSAHTSFVRFWFSRVAGVMANQMLMVALGWQMYDLTRSAWQLGLVGLVFSFALILKNLPGLVGNSTPIAIGVVVLLVAVFALGAGIAARRPHVVLE